MFALYFSVSLGLILLQGGQSNANAIRLAPASAIMHTMDTARFVCTKAYKDSRTLTVRLSTNISDEHARISTRNLNDTAIEIVIYSGDYLQAFALRCLFGESHDSGARSDVVIGKPPGRLIRTKRCTVYLDQYIECTITAPIMVQAIAGGLEYEFRFIERPLFSRPRVYRPDPKLVTVNVAQQTLTFRWWPESPEYFPARLKMNVSATIRHFGSSAYIMDMTPVFQISSNFTVTDISSTAIQIQFDHHDSPYLTICHGNVTKEKTLQLDEEEIRVFDEFNASSTQINDLHPHTWYQLCFHCRRDEPFETTSERQCHHYRTTEPPSQLQTLGVKIALAGLLLAVLGVLSWKACNFQWIGEKLQRLCRRKQSPPIVLHVPQSSVPLMLPPAATE